MSQTTINEEQLQQLNVSIGRYFEGYTTIEINFKTNLCVHSQWRGSETKKITVRTFTEDEKIKLNQMFCDSHLFDWKTSYLNSDYYEGTKWSVEILTNVCRIKKYGENQFPLEWDYFCEEIELFSLS
ncbi:MAG: hypothetical protein ACRCST_10830 [Turicibacter sp.]